MSQLDKLLEKFSRKPTPTGILFAEADRLLKSYGFIQNQPSGGSSHYIYTHPKLEGYLLTISKHSGKLKKGYVRGVVDAIVKLKNLDGRL